jgi:hypothetical protein
MPGTLTPAFDRYPKEAAIVGRLLAGYAELEFQLGLCAERALRKSEHPGYPESVPHKADNRHVALKALYRLRSESGRLQVADALARSEYTYLGLEAPYADAIGAIRHCLKIRNQFAHCHWGTDPYIGLIFTDLEENARGVGDFTFDSTWRSIDLALLQLQEAYFEYTMRCLEFIHGEFRVRAKMASSHPHAKPTKTLQPLLYKPPTEYEPPSIDPTE